MSIVKEMLRACELRGDTYSSAEIWGLLGRGAAEIEQLCAENTRLTKHAKAMDEIAAERDELLAALRDMIEISKRNSEATLMLIAIRKCAEHAIAKANALP